MVNLSSPRAVYNFAPLLAIYLRVDTTSIHSRALVYVTDWTETTWNGLCYSTRQQRATRFDHGTLPLSPATYTVVSGTMNYANIRCTNSWTGDCKIKYNLRCTAQRQRNQLDRHWRHLARNEATTLPDPPYIPLRIQNKRYLFVAMINNYWFCKQHSAFCCRCLLISTCI